MNRALAEVKEICRGRGEYNVDDVYDDLFDAHRNDPPYSKTQVAAILGRSAYSIRLGEEYVQRGRGTMIVSKRVMQYRFREG